MTTKKNAKHAATYAAKAHAEATNVPSDDELIQMGVALGLSAERASQLLAEAKADPMAFGI